MNNEIFIVSLVALLLVLMVLMVLCWILRRNRMRDVTELQISAGRPARVMIKTEADNAQDLLDRLLDRVFLQEELDDENSAPDEELGEERRTSPRFSISAILPTRAVNTLRGRLWHWMTRRAPPKEAETEATPSPPPTPPPPTDEDQTDDQTDDQANDISSQDAFSSGEEEEEEKSEAPQF